jgi:hypothetical protein
MLPADAVKLELPRASQTLADVQALAEKAKSAPAPEQAGELAAKLVAARELIAANGNEGDRLERFDRELLAPASEIAGRKLDQIDAKAKAAQDLAKLVEPAKRFQDELAEAFEKRIREFSLTENSPIAAALQRFDSLPRWQRVQSILLEGESQKMLASLAERYDLQVLMLDGADVEKVWQPTARDSALPAGLPKPTAESTNLSAGLKAGAGAQADEERGAVVIFSDGQHNEGEPPVEVAKVFGARGNANLYSRPRSTEAAARSCDCCDRGSGVGLFPGSRPRADYAEGRRAGWAAIHRLDQRRRQGRVGATTHDRE